MALTKKQQALIDAFIEYPLLPFAEHCRNLGIAPKTAYNWKSENKNGFYDEMERRLAEKWEQAKYAASETMFNLMAEGDFKAAKYILDYSGYAPAQKIEADVNNVINVNIEE